MTTLKKKDFEAAAKNVKKRVMSMSKEELLYAEAIVGMSLLASALGAGYYFWNKKNAPTVDLKKLKVNIIKEIKKAGKHVSNHAKTLSNHVQKMTA